MEKIVYVTADGKEFDHSRDCEKYCENNGTTFKEVKKEIKEVKETKEK
jgi:hypothetical protein